MSGNNEVESPKTVGTGGKVWSPPTLSPSPLSHPQGAFRKFVQDHDGILRILGIILLFGGVLVGLLYAEQALRAEDSTPLKLAYEQEYGYSDVQFDLVAGEADVTIATTGETEKVNATMYKTAVIFYDTRDQLEKKMDKVDAGTYAALEPLREE